MSIININRDEVLRYLGYKNQDIDEELSCLINTCISEVNEIAKPLFTYKLFNIEVLEDEIKIPDSNLVLRGKDIYEHLKNSKKCAIIAATIGVSFDNRVRYLSKTDITKSLIIDSCGTEAVENLCNIVEEQIKYIAQKEGKNIHYRFSPGYGDLSIDIQPQILSILNTQSKIGLTCTESCILLPRKSVTAIIGFVDDTESTPKGCSKCSSYKNCLYRKDGINCGI